MKPGKNDRRYKIKIAGLELQVLQKLTGLMCEAFGLDNKIDAYKGTRDIAFYSWDLDCLETVLDIALQNPAEEEITDPLELEALKSLNIRVRDLIAS